MFKLKLLVLMIALGGGALLLFTPKVSADTTYGACLDISVSPAANNCEGYLFHLLNDTDNGSINATNDLGDGIGFNFAGVGERNGLSYEHTVSGSGRTWIETIIITDPCSPTSGTFEFIENGNTNSFGSITIADGDKNTTAAALCDEQGTTDPDGGSGEIQVLIELKAKEASDEIVNFGTFDVDLHIDTFRGEVAESNRTESISLAAGSTDVTANIYFPDVDYAAGGTYYVACITPQNPASLVEQKCGERFVHNKALTETTIAFDDIDTLLAFSDTVTDEEVPEIGCTAQSGSFGWVICPLINGMLQFVDFMADLIGNFLQVPPVQLDSGTPTYEIWKIFRDISLGLLVVAMLVMVFGQALSLSIDAYTVKKMLPRIAIAAIGIMLSIYVAALLIDFFNVLGYGVRALVTAPIEAAGFNIAVGGFGDFAGVMLGMLAGGVILFSIGIGGFMMLVLIPVVLAFMAVYLTLVLRQVVIVMLVIVAPLAFVAWTIPSTEKYFKMWSSTFLKALMMYPLIMLLLASGQVFAVIITNVPSGQPGWINTITALVALTIPMFLVPATFRLSGGAIAATSNLAQGMAKKYGDKGKEWQQPRSAERRKKMAAGAYYNKDNKITGKLGAGLNKFTAGVASGPKGWVNKGVRDEKQSTRLKVAAAAAAENPEFGVRAVDEKALVAHTNMKEAVRMRGEAEAKGKTADVEMWDNAIAASKSMGTGEAEKYASFQALMSAGRGFGEGDEAHRFISETAAQFSGGSTDNAQYRGMMNEAQFRLDKAGRYDVGGINNGQPYSFDAGWNRANLYQLATGKKETFQAAQTHLEHLTRAGASQEELDRAYVMHTEMQQMLPNATGENRDALVDAMGAIDMSALEARVGITSAGAPAGGIGPTDSRGPARRRREILNAGGARVYERPNDNRRETT